MKNYRLPSEETTARFETIVHALLMLCVLGCLSVYGWKIASSQNHPVALRTPVAANPLVTNSPEPTDTAARSL